MNLKANFETNSFFCFISNKSFKQSKLVHIALDIQSLHEYSTYNFLKIQSHILYSAHKFWSTILSFCTIEFTLSKTNNSLMQKWIMKQA